MAPTEAGPSTFVIEVQGSDDEDSDLAPVKRIATDGTMTVNVRDQVSGGGEAEIDTGGDVSAGDMNRTITITYTAAGEIEDGMLKFTVPDKWSGEDQQNLVAANVEIDSRWSYWRHHVWRFRRPCHSRCYCRGCGLGRKG